MQDRATPTDEALARAHARLLENGSLQFDRTGFDPPAPPRWLGWIGDLMQAVAPLMKWIFWIGLALLAGLILYAIVREILRLRAPTPKPAKARGSAAAAWRPDPGAARDLLAEADRLAADGRYAEAVHLLLLRSVADIERRQPRALRASLTTREIAALEALPETGRPAFVLIGRVVEASLFGGASVDAGSFADCRRAYEAFALPEAWSA
ncbi:hypothetical protein [Brevundimonas sp.]|uniref:hypothetical protein n=1 Tax=Brevundimonas sp. TaxID=1871086 RepID=UPI0035B30246